MKRWRSFLTLLGFLVAALPREARPADKSAPFNGGLSATLARSGGETNLFLFTRKGNRLRIENTDKSRPEPVNIVELDSGGVTILFPHNSTFARLNPAKAATLPAPGPAPLVAFTPRLPAPGLPQGVPPPSVVSPASPPNSPAPPAGLSTPPASFPTLPAGVPALPAMPFPMPPMPMPGQASSYLTKTTTNRTIQGLVCTLYTITNQFECCEVWATSDSVLFPFRLLERDYPNRRFGPQLLEDQWAGLLQKQSLFPLEATLRNAGGPDRLSFKVTAIEKKMLDHESAKLFAVPDNFFEIQPPQF